MNSIEINASGFVYSSVFYNREFESIMSQIVVCYNLMKSNDCSLQNKENLIRNEMVNNYLMNKNVRENIGINKYLFYRELPTIDDTGRVDIYVVMQNTFQDVDACYIIECKRLNNKNTNGKTGLNAEYIQNGISRFISQKYKMHENTAGMIGFVVEKMDVHKNVCAINDLLNRHFTNMGTEQGLKYKEIVSGFEYSYFSTHKAGRVSKTIYHLMFDFSDNISS